MSNRAAKQARRAKRKAKQQQRGRERTLVFKEVATPSGPEVHVYESQPKDWEIIGIPAARPPGAPGKQRVACSRCWWKGQRHTEYYVHPDRAPDGSKRKRGDLSLRKAFEVDPTAKACPRCGGAVQEA